MSLNCVIQSHRMLTGHLLPCPHSLPSVCLHVPLLSCCLLLSPSCLPWPFPYFLLFFIPASTLLRPPSANLCLFPSPAVSHFFPLSDFMSACPGLRLRQQQQHFLCKYIPVNKHVNWNFCLQRLVSMNPSKGRRLYTAGSGQCLDGSATKSNNVSENVSLFMPLGNTFLPKSFSV